MNIAIDFDGTCVTHEYPNIGKDIGAVPVLKALVAKGHKLMLWTMRSGERLVEAIHWFKENDIALYLANTNLEQLDWTESPKLYAPLYIDDAALGAPLFQPIVGRPFIDWEKAEVLLIEKGLL